MSEAIYKTTLHVIITVKQRCKRTRCVQYCCDQTRKRNARPLVTAVTTTALEADKIALVA